MSRDARCYVEISLPQIARNFRAVRNAVGPAAHVIAVVKANAYGHGAIEVARTVVREGAGWLAVSSVEEGICLRQAGIEARLLVMAGVMNWEHEALREFRLTPVAHSLDDLQRFDSEAAGKGQREATSLDVHLKLDTGMHRMGTGQPAAAIAEAISNLPHVRVEGLLSHFASAADFTSVQTDDQIAEFEHMTSELGALGVHPPLMHFASTNAIAYPRRKAWLSLVRPGHAIYGYVSPPRGHAPASCIAVKPALTWKARIATTKEIPAGAKVGYGGSFVAPVPMRIAVLSAGYADGVPHRLSNKGKVIAGGKLAAIVGTVSMDLTTIDITHSPQLQQGDEVTLLGREGDVSLDAQQIARVAGTISYNVLCGISGRVKRFYIDQQEVEK